MAMQTICAWCNTTLGALGGDPTAPISHGICTECRDHFFGNGVGVPTLEEFLDRLDAPVLVVDGDGVVLTANQGARELVQKSASAIRGHLGGEVMECAYARLPEGCGRTVHCEGCAIRNTVMATHADGVERVGVEAFQDLSGLEGVQRMRILITTEKVGPSVLLRIDSIGPVQEDGAPCC